MRKTVALASLAVLACGATIRFQEMIVRVGAEAPITTWRVFLPWQEARSEPTQQASVGVDVEWTAKVRIAYGFRTISSSGGTHSVDVIACPFVEAE